MGYVGEELVDLAPPLDRGIRRFARDAVDDVGRDLRRRVRSHTPVARATTAEIVASYNSSGEWIRARGGRVPGTLRDSWQVGEVDLLYRGDVLRIAVFTLDPVAPHVEWDTIPHPIPAKRARALSIPTPTGMAFATLVQHPGTQGVHMMATAIQEVAVAWRRLVGRRWAAEARAARFWRTV